MNPLQSVAKEMSEDLERRVAEAAGGKSNTLAEMTVTADLLAILMFGWLQDPSDVSQRVTVVNNLFNRASGVMDTMVARVNEMGETKH